MRYLTIVWTDGITQQFVVEFHAMRPDSEALHIALCNIDPRDNYVVTFSNNNVYDVIDLTI